MPTFHLHQTTTSTPEQYVAGLTDFGPGRSKLFGNSADEYLKVHHRGSKEADVTEGSGGIWERLHYDWSDPNRVVLTTTDSNAWGGPSGHTYTFTRQPNGTTDINVVVVRDGKNLRGRVLGFVLGRIIMATALIAASGLALHVAWAQLPGAQRTDLQRHDLSVPGREAVQVIVALDPGVTAPRHTHPGEEIIYLLEGSLEYQVEGKPPVTLKVGDVLFIPAGTIHSARNVGKVRGAELATYIVEKGKPLLTLAK